MSPEIVERLLNKETGYNFHNRSKFTLKTLVADAANLQSNLRNYLNGFSIQAKDIFDYFDFETQIGKLEEADLLFQIAKEFSTKSYADLDAMEMGYVFEHLIRKFAEDSNKTEGEHFTPREIIKLMVDILFAEDGKSLTVDSAIRTLYDRACGTGECYRWAMPV